jgi:signal transduction histidine kinase
MSLFSTIVFALVLGLGTAFLLHSSNFTSGVWPPQSFKSALEFAPPVFDITKSGADLAPGYIFLTLVSPYGSVQSAAIMMTDTGDLIWNTPTGNYTDLETQSLDSQTVLTYWTDGAVGANGYGHISILNESYSKIYRVCPNVVVVTAHGETFPCYADHHENFITERASILITISNITTADLSSVNEPKNG